MKSNLVRFVSVVVLALVVFYFGWYFGSLNASKTINDSFDYSVEDSIDGEVSFMIDPGKGDIEVKKVSLNKGNNVFSYLFDIYGDKIEYQDYGGDLGMFIKKINGTGDDGSNMWWQYWVNNDYSEVGVSSYVPKAGDVIVLKFTDQQSNEL